MTRRKRIQRTLRFDFFGGAKVFWKGKEVTNSFMVKQIATHFGMATGTYKITMEESITGVCEIEPSELNPTIHTNIMFNKRYIGFACRYFTEGIGLYYPISPFRFNLTIKELKRS